MRTCVNACVFCFMTMLPKGGRSTLYIRDDDYRLSFLQGNFVTLTNLTDEDVQNVIDRNMSPMNVSVHAVSPDVRRRMMGRNAQRGMDVLETIMAAGIEIHAQIVLCPGMNDGEELEKTLRFCEEHEQITSLGIVPLGFTKHQNRFSWSYSDKPELARETIAMIRPFQDRASSALAATPSR
ncbi:MAG: radical SAM protein [Collinsella sp.]